MNLITKLRQAFFGKDSIKTVGVVAVQLQGLLASIAATNLTADVFSKYVAFKVQVDKEATYNVEATSILMQEYGVTTINGNRWQYETHEKAKEIAEKLSLINNRPIELPGNFFDQAMFNRFVSNTRQGVILSMDEVVFLSLFLLQKN